MTGKISKHVKKYTKQNRNERSLRENSEKQKWNEWRRRERKHRNEWMLRKPNNVWMNGNKITKPWNGIYI